MAEGYGRDIVTFLKPLNQSGLGVKVGQSNSARNPCEGDSKDEILVHWLHHPRENPNELKSHKLCQTLCSVTEKIECKRKEIASMVASGLAPGDNSFSPFLEPLRHALLTFSVNRYYVVRSAITPANGTRVM